MNYEIKITGEGTANQIATRLLDIARQLETAGELNEIPDFTKGIWEGDNLLNIEVTSSDISRMFSDRSGKVLKVGDTVNVPEPTKEDNWSHSFTGIIDSLDKKGYAIVIDGNQDGFAVEPERLEVKE